MWWVKLFFTGILKIKPRLFECPGNSVLRTAEGLFHNNLIQFTGWLLWIMSKADTCQNRTCMPFGSKQWGFNQVIKAETHFNSALAKWITTAKMDFHFILIHRITSTDSISLMVFTSKHPSALSISLSFSYHIFISYSVYWEEARLFPIQRV